MKRVFALSFALLLAIALPLVSPAFGQTHEDSHKRDYLPGEEVTTESGKKMRVWSTEGPVPVEPHPHAFDDPDYKGQLPGVVVTIDEEDERKNRRRHIRDDVGEFSREK